jgi:hypothetical protein
MKSLILCVVACTSASLLLAQGLGGAARKEQERRKRNVEAGAKVRTIGETELLSATEGKGTFSVAETPSSPEVGGGASGAVSSDAEGRPQGPSVQPRSGGFRAPDRLGDKTAAWRSRYHAAKQKADALEREVSDLEDQNSRIAGIAVLPGKPIKDSFGNVIGHEESTRDPNIRHAAERVRERLPKARVELARAKREFSSVEDDARRDGVASGQLY